MILPIKCKNIINQMWIAELDSQWWGVCIGGRHYTGNIRVVNFQNQNHPKFPNKIELERKLSLNEAKQLHEEQGRGWLKIYPTETNKFDTFKHLVKHAKNWCQKNLESDWILIENDWLNPNQVLGAKGSLEPRLKDLNTFYEKFNKIPNYRLENPRFRKRIYNQWYKLLNLESCR